MRKYFIKVIKDYSLTRNVLNKFWADVYSREHAELKSFNMQSFHLLGTRHKVVFIAMVRFNESRIIKTTCLYHQGKLSQRIMIMNFNQRADVQHMQVVK